MPPSKLVAKPAVTDTASTVAQQFSSRRVEELLKRIDFGEPGVLPDHIHASDLWAHPSLLGMWADAYEVLFGAIFCLRNCKDMLDGINNLTIQYHKKIFPKLTERLLANDTSGEELRSWQSEFYLNRAQHSISTCIDRILNALVVEDLNMDPAKGDGKTERWAVEDQAFFTWMGTRIHILCATRSKQKKLLPILVSIGEAFNQKGASRKINDSDVVLAEVSNSWDEDSPLGGDLESHIGNLRLPFSGKRRGKGAALSVGAECAVFCIERTNQWKHLPLGTSRKVLPVLKQMLTMAEWVWTYEATEFAIKLWSLGMQNAFREMSKQRAKGANTRLGQAQLQKRMH